MKKFQKVDESQKFRESQLAAKSQILYFVPFLKRNFACTYLMTIIRRAMENPDLGQAFSNLDAIISPIEKFLEQLGAEEFPKNVEESKKFRESQLALKSKILCFLLISKRSFISTYRMIMIQFLHMS